MADKPKIGIVGFTGCAGCQLSILDLENELLDLLELVEIIDFRMAMTGNREGPYDVLFVEGSIVNPEQEKELIHLREQAKILVAIGTCAAFGGVQAIRNYGDNDKIIKTQYGSTDFNRVPVFRVKPINKVVKVDHYILECPVNKYEFLDFVKLVLIGGTPKPNNIPVCQQCKSNGYRCILVEDGIPCMGPVIQAGCNALCPSYGMPCDGCRGSTMQAAYQQHVDLLFEKGCSKEDITRLLLKYIGEDEQLRKFIQEKWSQQDKKLKYVEE